MKNKLLLRITFSTAILLLSGLLHPSYAQIIVSSKEKKSNPDIFFPNRKRTHPVPVRKENHLPPGQEKKIYHQRSAKAFAPGQRKKAYNYNGYSNKKHVNTTWKRHHKNTKNHGHHGD